MSIRDDKLNGGDSGVGCVFMAFALCILACTPAIVALLVFSLWL